jgi:hypothetical protein
MRYLSQAHAQKESAPFYVRVILEFPETGPPRQCKRGLDRSG